MRGAGRVVVRTAAGGLTGWRLGCKAATAAGPALLLLLPLAGPAAASGAAGAATTSATSAARHLGWRDLEHVRQCVLNLRIDGAPYAADL